MILGALAEVYEKVPVKIPNGTEGGVAAALRELHRCPDSGFESSRPGWSSVRYNEAMEDLKRFGQAAAPALLANIDNYRIQLAVIQVLGDLRVEEAVPELVERLWMEDCFHDSLIVAKLANITGHPEGYGFHRRWFDEAVRVKPVATYKQWWNVKALAKIQGESTGSARAP
jgi:hypothetical protein